MTAVDIRGHLLVPTLAGAKSVVIGLLQTTTRKFATGINNTGGKFCHWYRYGTVYGTCGKFAAGVNISANFRKKLKWL
jgi:hypothetical protein